MRPGRRFVRALTLLCIVALLVPVAPVVAVVIATLFLGLCVVAVTEALLLRRVSITNERAPRIAVSLDESEALAFNLTSNSSRALHLVVRQVWPRLVDSFADSREALLKPGEGFSQGHTILGRVLDLSKTSTPAQAAEQGQA